MRKINWDDKLSDEDIVWLRQTGIVGIEDRIASHQEQYDAKVPKLEHGDDLLTANALDPTSRANTPAETGDGPVKVDPTQADPPAEDELEDDYDRWSVDELEAEVTARNSMADTSTVEVAGTGAKGKVLKADLVKGLRLWDGENPDALK